MNQANEFGAHQQENAPAAPAGAQTSRGCSEGSIMSKGADLGDQNMRKLPQH